MSNKPNRPKPLRIPIDDLPEPQPYTKERVGFIFAHDTTIPIIIATNPAGTTIRLNEGHNSLGVELRDISNALSKEQVESLVKGESVKL